MKSFQITVLGILLYFGLHPNAYGLTASIYSQILTMAESGDLSSSCVNIAGDYPGFNIISSEYGKNPQICLDKSREHVNAIEFWHVTFVATESSSQIRTINFEHEFLNGPQGLIFGSTQIKGFFATENGIGIPTKNQIWFMGILNQANHDDFLAQELNYTVDEALESALFNEEAESKFVLSGSRSLRGVLNFILLHKGDKLVLDPETRVSLNPFEKKRE
ncbi:hypothetical protein [Candidatus Nitrosacidococcus tergens]|uniref:Uncharacterized protein n=1 Tax=Candidatus Nitrosacidococcus tergens TaxID=553981 RepID=A0A7G1QCN3_9GAMM|nr:hypothetical protein [Candidatus Nitrosacidococcus tergens]CAB1277502.1 conserved protein of unknown function [Candidatus Nitrosacidococcus tergens]